MEVVGGRFQRRRVHEWEGRSESGAACFATLLCHRGRCGHYHISKFLQPQVTNKAVLDTFDGTFLLLLLGFGFRLNRSFLIAFSIFPSSFQSWQMFDELVRGINQVRECAKTALICAEVKNLLGVFEEDFD